MKIEKQTITMALLLCFSGAWAQTAVPASGGDASGNGGSMGYSVGQVFFTTSSAAAGSMATGIQHAYDVSVISGLEVAGISLEYNVYPNPTSNKLELRVENFEYTDLSCMLFNAEGTLLQTHRLHSILSEISLENLAPAMYFLKVISGQQEIKTFKIIKK
jgi:hypothetical protein